MKRATYFWVLFAFLVDRRFQIYADGKLAVSSWWLWAWILGVLNSFAVFLQPESGSYRVCLEDSFEVTCNVQSASQICWDLSIPGHKNFATKCFIINFSVIVEQAIGPFLLLKKADDPLISTASLSSVENFQNGSVLTCSSTVASSPLPNETSDIVILLEGKFATSHSVYVYLHAYLDKASVQFSMQILLLLHWIPSCSLSPSLQQPFLGLLPMILFVSLTTL